jgi:hypothetical protein
MSVWGVNCETNSSRYAPEKSVVLKERRGLGYKNLYAFIILSRWVDASSLNLSILILLAVFDLSIRSLVSDSDSM